MEKGNVKTSLLHQARGRWGFVRIEWDYRLISLVLNQEKRLD